MKELIDFLARGGDLDTDAVRRAADQLLDPEISTELKGAFLTALHSKGETPAEIAGFVNAFLDHAVRPVIHNRQAGGPLLDVCGTGGDKAGFFNVSTAVMFVCAAAGARVVKHGNRGISSKSGGADVLDALGVPVELDRESAGDFLERCGFVFLFAPKYHPAFAAVAPVRKELAARGRLTVFNILGPLLNPALPDYQLAGVFQPHLPAVYAEVFRLLGRKAAWAVHGHLPDKGALDEISTLGSTDVCSLDATGIQHFEIHPEQLDIRTASADDLLGGTPSDNARILLDLLEGRDRGPRKDLVAVNASAALCVCGMAADLPDGLRIASRILESGAAREVLRRGSGR